MIGDPYHFSILVKVIKEWNLVGSSWRNGVLIFCINGELFPKKIVTATLNSEIRFLQEILMNVTINDELFKMEKEKAFFEMYNITFPNDIEEDRRYFISPPSLSDSDSYAFAVSNGQQIRVMGAELDYIRKDSIHDLYNIQISETFITHDELSKIISELSKVLA